MGTKVEITFETGPSGRGEIRCLKDGVKIIASDGSVYEDISYDAVYCPLPEDAKQGKSYSPMYFKLNRDGTALYSLWPWGTETDYKYYVKFAWFPRKEGEAPSTYTQRGKRINYPSGFSDWRPDHEVFNAELEIVAGKFKGLLVKKQFGYQMFEDPDTGLMMIGGHGNWFGGWARELILFLRLAGYDPQEDQIRWADDEGVVLAALEKVLQDRDVVFEITIKDGWVKDMTPMGDGVTIG